MAANVLARRWFGRLRLAVLAVSIGALAGTGACGQTAEGTLQDRIERALRSMGTDWPEECRSGIERLSRILDTLRAGDLARYSDPYGEVGMGPDVASRIYIIRELEHAAGVSVPAIRLLSQTLDLERNPEVREKAAALFRGMMEHASPIDLQRAFLQGPPTSSLAVVEFLSVFKRRGITLPVSVLARYHVHHSESVRRLAASMMPDKGAADPAVDDVARSPHFVAFVKRLRDRARVVPPRTAALVEIRTMGETHNDETVSMSLYGWLLSDADAESVDVMLLSGARVRFPRKGPIDELSSMDSFTAEARTEVIRRPLPQIVRHIARMADNGGVANRRVLLSPRSCLSEVGRCTHAELMLGCWLHARGSAVLAAEVLMSAVARLPSDDRALAIMRMEQGRLVGCEMIRAFVGDRDIERALQLAGVVVNRYPGTVHSALAARLHRELPLRLNDFGSHRLPTPAEWNQIRKPLTRQQQVDFLLGRLRLLNAFKSGQPVGGLGIEYTQCREPVGITADAAWGLNRGITPVINPFVELKRMLRKGDLPTLVNRLDGTDWSFLAVSFNRNFKEERQLESTLCLVVELIDHVAGTKLVDRNFSRLRDLGPETRRAVVRRLRRELGLPPR